jgi:hypothetical protein
MKQLKAKLTLAKNKVIESMNEGKEAATDVQRRAAQVRQAKAILYYEGFRDAAVQVDPELEAGSALPAGAKPEEQTTERGGSRRRMRA